MGTYYKLNRGGSGYLARGLLWTDGQMIEIDPLPGYSRSSASDINDMGSIIGTCSNGPGTTQIFYVMHEGVMHDLITLIPPDTGLEQIGATAINNAGQIAGTASYPNGDTVGVLLTPIPPMPSDTNCNKLVDVDDLLTVINGWGACKKFSPCPGDLLENDVVDVDDLLLVINNWSI